MRGIFAVVMLSIVVLAGSATVALLLYLLGVFGNG